MFVKTVAEFCKSEICPSAETLLGFESAELFFAEMMGVSAHLAECEFCLTELYFLTNFPQTESNCEPAPEIPSALKQLAEALLGDAQSEFRLLNILLSGNEQLTFKNA
ncbi:MAG: hypothetical protein M3209_05425 [Acidobacteriota bacterium]|nr:hypothetical protein [Acidobacteriota bacterium]